MNVLLVVLTIAVGTAVLAALIVAADWDLDVIRAYRGLNRQPEHHSIWQPSPEALPRTDFWSAEFVPARSVAPAAADRAARTRADEWLAAAAAHRLSDFDRSDGTWPEQASVLPATPLRELLAARRDRFDEDEAAA